MKKSIENTRQLNELRELPDSIFTDDIVGIGADSDSPNIVQKMVSNQVVCHKTCRNSIITQNIQRALKRSGPEVAICPKTRRLRGKYSTSLNKPVATMVCFFCAEMGSKKGRKGVYSWIG